MRFSYYMYFDVCNIYITFQLCKPIGYWLCLIKLMYSCWPCCDILPLFSDGALIMETVLYTSAQLIRATTMARLPLLTHVLHIALWFSAVWCFDIQESFLMAVNSWDCHGSALFNVIHNNHSNDESWIFKVARGRRSVLTILSVLGRLRSVLAYLWLGVSFIIIRI